MDKDQVDDHQVDNNDLVKNNDLVLVINRVVHDLFNDEEWVDDKDLVG